MFKRKSEKNKRAGKSRRQSSSRPSFLYSNSKGGQKGKKLWLKITAVIILLSLLIAVIAIGFWLTFRIIGNALFQNNRFFCITQVELVHQPAEVTRDEIFAALSIKADDNLFSFNLSEARVQLLEKLPKLKNVELSRRFPGKLHIRVTEREPMASLKITGSAAVWAMDEEGHVLGFTRIEHLPLVMARDIKDITPGMLLRTTPVMLALDVLNAVKENDLLRLRQIERLDVRKKDQIELLLKDGSEIFISWDSMYDRTIISQENLLKKLKELEEILRSGRPFKRLDMTLRNNYPGQ